MAPWGPKSEGEVCVDKEVLGHFSRSDHSDGPQHSPKACRNSKPKRHLLGQHLGQRIKVMLPVAGLTQEEWKHLGQKTTDSRCPAPHPAPALLPEDSTFSDTPSKLLKLEMNTQSQSSKHLKKTLTVTETPNTSKRRARSQKKKKKKRQSKTPVIRLSSRMDTAEDRFRKLVGGIEKFSQKQ